jgi:hypothetical protein
MERGILCRGTALILATPVVMSLGVLAAIGYGYALFWSLGVREGKTPPGHY